MFQQDFIDQLKQLSFETQDLGDNRVAIPFTIASGRFIGQQIRLGFIVPQDFPLTPPSGPHVSPRLLPMPGSGNTHPNGGIHESPFGSEWQYWSRPLSHWNQTGRTVKDVLAHIRHLFDTIP